MRNYEQLATYDRDGFEIIVDKTWEELNPTDFFEPCDTGEINRKINDGTYDWFMLRARVMVDSIELASHYLSGCCYENPEDVLTDGTAENLITWALEEAKNQVYQLSRKFTELSYRVDAERCAVNSN
jgi:hypothetical protein